MAGVWQRLATAAIAATFASAAVAQEPSHRSDRKSTQANQEAKRPPLPLEVEFSVPVDGDADVRLDTTIRVKFSRDANPASFADRIRASYSKEESVERGEAHVPTIAFTTSYSRSTHVLEIAPRQPLERFRQVRVELLPGIVGQDGSVLRPWTLRFRTGGS